MNGITVIFRGFTKHGLERVLQRNFTDNAIKNIFNHGTKTIKMTGRNGTAQLHITYQKNTVVFESVGRNAGKIVTIY